VADRPEPLYLLGAVELVEETEHGSGTVRAGIDRQGPGSRGQEGEAPRESQSR